MAIELNVIVYIVKGIQMRCLIIDLYVQVTVFLFNSAAFCNPPLANNQEMFVNH